MAFRMLKGHMEHMEDRNLGLRSTSSSLEPGADLRTLQRSDSAQTVLINEVEDWSRRLVMISGDFRQDT